MIKVVVTHTLTAEDIDDLITTMVECNDMTASWCQRMEASKQVSLAILNGENVKCFVDNSEEGLETVELIFNLEGLRKAFQLAVEDPCYQEVVSRIVSQDYDAIDADVILQLALFGEVVYG